MKEIILAKCGELVLKGLNRYKFEDKLAANIRRAVRDCGACDISYKQSTIYIAPQNPCDIDAVFDRVRRVFGVVALQRAAVCEKNIGDMQRAACDYLADQLKKVKTFRVTAKRADKRFPLQSPEIASLVGEAICRKYPHLSGNMDAPGLTVTVEVREEYAFVSGEKVRGAGGMPVGTNGRAMLLLSGGIDSPVAGHMIAKRGVDLAAVHFYSYPYTSEQALQKVYDIAGVLSQYTGKLTVSVVPFTEIQEQIRKHCDESYATLIMRRMMMRIAERAALHQHCSALVTGESLGQVASQTIESLGCTEAVCTLPVLRPVVGMDKEEIVSLARKINTFDISVLPYEDCCTVFTPRHPQTKPRLEKVEQQEQALNVQELVDSAFDKIERVTFG